MHIRNVVERSVTREWRKGCLWRKGGIHEELWVNQIHRCGYIEFYFSKGYLAQTENSRWVKETIDNCDKRKHVSI